LTEEGAEQGSSTYLARDHDLSAPILSQADVQGSHYYPRGVPVCSGEPNRCDDNRGDRWDHVAIDAESVEGAVGEVKSRTGGRVLRLVTRDEYPAYETAWLDAYGQEVATTATGRPARKMVAEKMLRSCRTPRGREPFRARTRACVPCWPKRASSSNQSRTSFSGWASLMAWIGSTMTSLKIACRSRLRPYSSPEPIARARLSTISICVREPVKIGLKL
jgi:hypothetical protein